MLFKRHINEPMETFVAHLATFEGLNKSSTDEATNSKKKTSYSTAKGQKILSVPICFDIETVTTGESEITTNSLCFTTGSTGKRFCDYGNTYWFTGYNLQNLFTEFLQRLVVERRRKGKNHKSIALPYIYVHNLQYEWFNVIRNSAVALNMDVNIPLAQSKMKPNRIEMLKDGRKIAIFIDTVRQSGAGSLKNWTENLPHAKKDGDFDYDRTDVWTSPEEYTDEEKEYIFCDTEGMIEALDRDCESWGYKSHVELPWTHTGKVRRVAKHLAKDKQYSALLKNVSKLHYNVINNMSVFNMVKHGGLTGTNSKFVHKYLQGVIKDYDISSSYPYQLLSRKFQSGAMSNVEDKERQQIILKDFLRDTARSENMDYSGIVSLTLHGVKPSQSGNYQPLIFTSRVRGTTGGMKLEPCAVAEVDISLFELKYIFKFYSVESVQIIDMWVYEIDYLSNIAPWLVKLVKDGFDGKTKLKGVKGMELLYAKLKSQLNSLFGMVYTSPENPSYAYNDETGEIEETGDTLEHKFNGIGIYSWGCDTAMYGRCQLMDAILANNGEEVYHDTDSIKVLNPTSEFDVRTGMNPNFPDYTAVDIKGKVHILGIWEQDPDLVGFKTIGAKAYMKEVSPGKYKYTVAGFKKEILDSWMTPDKFYRHMSVPAELSGALQGTVVTKADGTVGYILTKASRQLTETAFDLACRLIDDGDFGLLQI